jgi:DNA-binding SARP family transcriptional activator
VSLRVSVLGAVRVEREGIAIDPGGPRQRAVVARLVAAQGHLVPAERLLADVWGDDGARLSSVHVAVSNVRRALEPERKPRTPSVLSSRNGGYSLDAETDADDLANAARQGVALLAQDEPAQARAVLSSARDLWAGDPYDDLGDLPWLVRERTRLHDLRLIVAERLAEAMLRLGANVEVALDLAPLSAEHPARERLGVLLAVALYRDQRQDDALAVLRRVRQHLSESVGLDPGPDLRAVETAILSQQPDPMLPAPPSPAAPAPLPATQAGPLLIGRERPLAVLAAAAATALSGQSAFAVVVGEAGIGKTRLARELADELSAQSWTIAWTGSSEGDGAPALWPWISVLNQLDRPLTSDLQRLVVGDAVQPVDPAAARWRQQRAVRDQLVHVAAERPLLVVLEDVHWADSASQALLLELVDSLSEARILVLVTARPGPTAVLARLARGRATRLDLESFSELDVRALLATTGQELDSAALHRRTGGNPFLLKETLALARQTGTSALDVVPATVADVLRARAALLPGAGQDVLAVASVIGDVVEPGIVADLLNLDLSSVEGSCDSAVDAGLLTVGADGRLRFRHDLVRETAYADLGPLRRQRLHGRVFAHLLAHDRRSPSRLAAQAVGAGPELSQQAVTWCSEAAREAARRLAHGTAVSWWQQAVDVDRQRPEGDPSREVEVLLGLVGAQLDAGDAVGALDTRLLAVEAARVNGEPHLMVRALTALSRPLVWILGPRDGHQDGLVGDLEKALDADVDPVERCSLLATLALELYGRHDPRCDDLSAEAIRLAEAVGDARVLAFAVNARQLAIARPGREAERAELADRLIDIGRSAGLATAELAGHQLAAQARLQLFEVPAADRHADRARALASDLKLPLPQLQQQLWDSSRRLLDGDLPGALGLLADVADLDWPWWGRHAMLATVQLTLLLRAGAPADAADLLDAAAWVHPQLAADAAVLCHVAKGIPAELPPAAERPRDWMWRAAACIRAQAAVAVGDTTAQLASYHELLPEAGLLALVGSIDAGPVDAHLVSLAVALGRPDEAELHRERLRTKVRAAGLTPALC